jgi:polyhydroxybutyrate depolymerase
VKIRFLLVPAALVIVGCSGSDTASDVTTPAPSATDAVSTGTTPVSEPETDEPGSTSPASIDAPSDPDAPTTTEAPPVTDGFVINGPARVRPACDTLTPGVSEFTLEAGGAVHDVRIFVPTNVVSDPAPVVLNWHGLSADGGRQAASSGYEMLSEQEGFIAVHPTGVGLRTGGPNFWEVTRFELPQVLDDPVRDDLAFADSLIDTVVADWCADPDRVYSTGLSNGGYFTSELVCNRADRIAAAVSVAGITHPESCAPSRAVPYLAFHGTDDNVVPYAGAGESLLVGEVDPDGFFGQVMPDEFAEFAADAGCDPDPVRTEETPEVTSYVYSGCADDVPMTFYEIVGGGHTWPGSPQADQQAIFGLVTDDISATADGWAFMSQHSL